MSIREYTYVAGRDLGAKKHEDGQVESLYGYKALGEETKYVNLPDNLGGGRVDIIHRAETTCPIKDCGEIHNMVMLDCAEGSDEHFIVVECPKHGFLWCTL